jgi:hypothetical protein
MTMKSRGFMCIPPSTTYECNEPIVMKLGMKTTPYRSHPTACLTDNFLPCAI